MAETRAKARALRDAVNVGVTTLEELGDEEPTPTPRQARATHSGASEGQPEGQSATPAQVRWLDWAYSEGHIRLEKKAEEHTKREAWQIREKFEKAQNKGRESG